MPIYEFRCKQCDAQFEEIRPLGDDGRTLACPKCGTKRPKKLLSSFAASSGRSGPEGCAAPEACGGSFG